MIENRITIHKDGKQYEIIPNRILEYEIKNNLSLNGFLFVVKLQDKDWTLQDNLGIGNKTFLPSRTVFGVTKLVCITNSADKEL